MGILEQQSVKDKIISLRGQDVILDFAVAEIYGVETKEINQAVRNNPKKFPEGYLLQLDIGEKQEVVKIFTRTAEGIYRERLVYVGHYFEGRTGRAGDNRYY